LAAPVLADPQATAAPDGDARAQASGSRAKGEAGGADTFQLSLEEAYKKEFAFLVSQKKQLKSRLDAMKQRFGGQERAIEQEVARLENRLLAVEDALSDAREEVQGADRQAQSTGEEAALVSQTLEQARTSLSDYDVQLPEAETGEDEEAATPSVEAVETVFRAGVDVLERLSALRREEGRAFFLEDGTKTTGTIIHVGRVAAYGVSDAGAGALVPAGAGKLEIWHQPAAETARALLSGEDRPVLDMFIFESLDGQVSADAEESVIEHIDSGGAIAWVIMSLGAIGILLSVVRALILTFSGGREEKVLAAAEPHVREGQLGEAARAADEIRGSAARVTTSVFRSLSEGADRVDEAVSGAMLGESRNLQRFGTVILVIAAVAPLLGLLGTVTGMISTFDVITKFGTGDPKMLSGGISTALVTTELGLVVAIPTLLLGNILKSWAEGIEAKAERTALRLVTLHTGEADQDEA
jgi:biopolymer transport protein ExbB